jgi:hypothetical protein
MSDTRTAKAINGSKPTGERLDVSIYASSREDALKQYAFRYSALGYRAHDAENEEQQQSAPSRRRTITLEA